MKTEATLNASVTSFDAIIAPNSSRSKSFSSANKLTYSDVCRNPLSRPAPPLNRRLLALYLGYTLTPVTPVVRVELCFGLLRMVLVHTVSRHWFPSQIYGAQ